MSGVQVPPPASDVKPFFSAPETPPSCPPGLGAFQKLMADDAKARTANQERLRELALNHGGEVRLFCAHDPVELEREVAV